MKNSGWRQKTARGRKVPRIIIEGWAVKRISSAFEWLAAFDEESYLVFSTKEAAQRYRRTKMKKLRDGRDEYVQVTILED